MARAGPAIGLGPEHRRWLIINALAITAIINFVLNAVIAWATTSGERAIPLMSIPVLQAPSTLTDTPGTLLCLPLITTLLVTASVRRDQRLGRVSTLDLGERAQLLARLPRRPLRRATVFGAGCLALFGPLAAILLVALNFGGIAQSTFVLYKAILSVGLGLLVTPVIALAALADRRAG